MRLVKPNWDIFKAKFSENPQENFEWFCYLLFSKEHNQTYGIHRYKNQSGIETDPIEVNNEVIGWQSKFYEDTLSNHKKDLIETLEKTKRDYHNITKIILYTNSEWGQGQGTKEPKAKIEAEEKAKELNIELAWRTKSYFESLFVCQEQRDISRYFFELKSKWELTNLGFQDKLIQKYQTNFKIITLLLNDEKTNEIFIKPAIIKEQTEKDKKEKEEAYKRKATLNSSEEIQKPKESIELEELLNISKKSLIYGKAGVGKTTLCKYIAYKWAKKELYQAFDYVVYIALREWKRDGLKGAILDNYYSSDIKELYFNIKENNFKTLFLFDGYDELDADKKATLQKEINTYNLQNYIITTRPYGYQKSDFNVDESFETIGFTDENVEEYIENFFDESQKEKSLKEFLQNNINIKHIAYIPLMLEMICSLWEDEEFQESVTMTELYGQVVENILKKHSALKNDESVYKRQNRKKINEQLGVLAFKGLTQQKIVFDGDFIEKTLEDIEFFEQNTINSGFLKSDNIDKDLLDNNFEFLHLTFQEYFSALYVSKLSKEEQSKIIGDWKFYPHMQMFFAFLGGLIEDKEFLLREIESEPKDLVGRYELFLILILLNEIVDYENNNYIMSLNEKIIELLHSMIKESLSINELLDLIKINKYFHSIYMLEELIKILSIVETSYQMDIAKIIPYIGFHTEKDKFFKNIDNILKNDKLKFICEFMLESFHIYSHDTYLFNILINKINNAEDEKIINNYFYLLASLDSNERKVLEFLKNKLSLLHEDIEKLGKYPFGDSLDIYSYLSKKLDNKKELEQKYYDKLIYFSEKCSFNVYNPRRIKKESSYTCCCSEAFILTDGKETDDECQERAIDILAYTEFSDERFSIRMKKNFMYDLANCPNINKDNRIFNIVVYYIYNKDEYEKFSDGSNLFNHSKRLLMKIEVKREDRIRHLLKLIKDTSYDKIKEQTYLYLEDNKFISETKHINIGEEIRNPFLSKLFTIDYNEKWFFDELLKIWKRDKNIDLSKSSLIKYISDDYIKKLYDFGYKFEKNIQIDVLFKVYNTGLLNMIKNIREYCQNHNKPLYIKNNKLHTIENGKVISTQREVDEETLNEIKKLLKGDNLDD